MSVLNKNWKVINTSEKSLKEKLLENRGFFGAEEINEFLDPEMHCTFHDPYLFEDMKKAVKRIKDAISKNERIVIFGDYDVDGISATAILVKVLQKMKANVSYRLPHRLEDGYGLKQKFIEEFKELGVKLVITVDCGISCVKETEFAKKNGIDVIITDHHTIPAKKPKKAFAIIHPMLSNYPCEHLTGAGVALKLAQALTGSDAEELLGLAAMGTVADIGLLKGENRLIVKRGLKNIAETDFPGLKSLKKGAGVDDRAIDAGTIGFQIGPRINAAGRIDSPYFALQLLLHEDVEKGRQLAQKLEELNDKRREMLQEALLGAEEFFENQKDKYILIKEDPDWHVGILGLIAGRLSEKYGLPAIILQDFGDHLTASARSSENFNIIEALTHHSKFLKYFGGHAQAAGFDIKKENYDKFKEAILDYASSKLKGSNLSPVLNIDCEINADEINEGTLDLLETLRPFGAGNEQPRFLIKGVNVRDVKKVGKDKSHLKISGEINEKGLDIIAFRFAEHSSYLRNNRKIDLVCDISRNKNQNFRNLQIKAIDFAKAS